MQLLYSVKLHLATLLSNHLHLLLTDVLGDQLANFNTHFFSLLSRSVNVHRGRRGNLLDPEGVNDVLICPRAEDLIHHGCYVSMNAVEAELVSHAKRWPGVCIRPSDMGRLRLEVRKPGTFFDPKGEIPDVVTVEFTIPEAMDCEPEELRRRMAEEHNRREEEKRRQMARDGRKFIGRKAILRQSPFTRPKHPLPLFDLVPHVACKDRGLRIRMLRWRKERNLKYRELLARVREGVKNVVFPVGTFVMHFRNGFAREPWRDCIWQMLAAET